MAQGSSFARPMTRPGCGLWPRQPVTPGKAGGCWHCGLALRIGIRRTVAPRIDASQTFRFLGLAIVVQIVGAET
jgi:hypothetical protein